MRSLAFSLERSELTVSGGPVWTPVPVGRVEEKGLTETAPRSSCSLRRVPVFSDLFDSVGSPKRRIWVRVVVGVGRRTGGGGGGEGRPDLSGREGEDLRGDCRGLGLIGFLSRFKQRVGGRK